jgi:addiction module HigA family antidote
VNIEENNPMHPGEFIQRVYLTPFGMDAKELATGLQVSQSIMSRILNSKGSISPPMALKLSKVIGRSAESWLLMQDQYDLWAATKTVNLDQYTALKFA